jgi:hypothetical protein
MARITDLPKIESPSDSNVFPVSDGQITRKLSLLDLKNAIVKQATPSILGSIKVGAGLAVSDTGVLSVKNYSGYTLPPASGDVLGGIRVGSGLTIDDTSVLSVNYVYNLPIASALQLGGVRIGSGIAINNGIISVEGANIVGGALGGIPYQTGPSLTTVLPGNITSTKKFLTEQGTGSAARSPYWSALAADDVGLANVTNESKQTMFSDPAFTGTVTTTSITAGSSTTAGSITGNWSITGSFQATYADLAEKYISDVNYEEGTVVVFGGTDEITVSNTYADTRVAGAISTNPAYVMNGDSTGQAVALRGKVPVKIIGTVKKGDLLVTSQVAGFAQVADSQSSPNAVFAKSLEHKATQGPGIVIAVIL